MVKKAVILCGGLGTRLLPYTKSVPKEMLPLLDKPVLQVLVEQLADVGITSALVVLGRNKEVIPNHFDKNVELDIALAQKPALARKCSDMESLLDITYKRCPMPLGTASAVKEAEGYVGRDPFLMLYGDEVVQSDVSVFAQLLRAYRRTRTSTIALQRVAKSDVNKYGIVSPEHYASNVYRILDLVEKPSPEHAPSDLSFIGSAVFRSEIFEYIRHIQPDSTGCMPITDALAEMSHDGRLYGAEISGIRHDLGDKFGFLRANIDYALADPDVAPKLKRYILDILPTWY